MAGTILTCALGLFSYMAVLSEPPHDGDTVKLTIDLGFGMHFASGPMRLAGINAPELKDAGGIEARDHLAAMISIDRPFLVNTVKDKRDKYGRVLVVICPDGPENLSANDRMIGAGYARAYGP